MDQRGGRLKPHENLKTKKENHTKTIPKSDGLTSGTNKTIREHNKTIRKPYEHDPAPPPAATATPWPKHPKPKHPKTKVQTIPSLTKSQIQRWTSQTNLKTVLKPNHLRNKNGRA